MSNLKPCFFCRKETRSHKIAGKTLCHVCYEGLTDEQRLELRELQKSRSEESLQAVGELLLMTKSKPKNHLLLDENVTLELD